MSTSEMTIEEVLDSVTGYDEIAVRKYFDIDLYTGNDERPMLVTRALIFVLKRRDGMKDDEAKEYAMALGMRAVNYEYFADTPDDADPDEPDSESGKGEPSSERPPTD